MTFKRLITSIALLAAFIMPLRYSIGADTWWHLRAGAWMVEHAAILRSDPFSLTRLGEPWIYPGWLAQLLLYGSYQLGGLSALNLLTAFSVLLAFGFVWKTLGTPTLIKAFTLILGVTVSGIFWSARPQIFSLALTGAVIWILNRSDERGPRILLILPIVFALWANLHGGFAIGVILLVLHLVGRSLDRIRMNKLRLSVHPNTSETSTAHFLVAGGASLLALALNPHGPIMLLYPLRTVSIGVLRDHIQEWQSPNFHQIEVQPFLWMFLLSMLFLALSPRKASWKELLTLTVFAYLGFVAARNIALFGIVAVPVLSRHAEATFQSVELSSGTSGAIPDRRSRWINLGLLLMLLIAAGIKAAVPLSERFNRETVADKMPADAIAFILAEQPAGPLFNTYNWGGYVVWTLHPKYLSFVDGRTDLFNDELLEEYLELWMARTGWQSRLSRWGIQLALLENEAPLAAAMLADGWDRIYQDEKAVVLALER